VKRGHLDLHELILLLDHLLVEVLLHFRVLTDDLVHLLYFLLLLLEHHLDGLALCLVLHFGFLQLGFLILLRLRQLLLLLGNERGQLVDLLVFHNHHLLSIFGKDAARLGVDSGTVRLVRKLLLHEDLVLLVQMRVLVLEVLDLGLQIFDLFVFLLRLRLEIVDLIRASFYSPLVGVQNAFEEATLVHILEAAVLLEHFYVLHLSGYRLVAHLLAHQDRLVGV